jgi:hypothetical protein
MDKLVNNMLKELEPIFCEDLLKDIDDKLYEIMKNIKIEDWNRSTIYPNWKIKDIFSHIIDTSIRRLSNGRDGFNREDRKIKIDTYKDLVLFIEKFADEWVEATKRISPQVLLSIFLIVKDELYEYIKKQNHFDEARASVLWAGEIKSKIWFDYGREYTEHWIHQQQIRDALNIHPLDGKIYLEAVLEILIRCLPVTYSNINRPAGTRLKIETIGAFSKEYYLINDDGKWNLYTGKDETADITIIIDSLILCKMLSRIIKQEEIQYKIIGSDIELGKEIEKGKALMA